MKMLTIKHKSYGLLAVVLASFIASFTPLAHAAPSASANAPFDHTRTGYVLKDVHATLKCEQCHVQGIFKNTPKDCAGCHATGTRVAATPKPINHVATTSACDTCHVSAANFLVKSYNHVGITGGCSNCHNGQSLGVVSKSVNHFPTTLPCESCHTNTSTFLSTRMDHTGVTSGCANCHAGQFPGVVSKPAMHIPTGSLDCGQCHQGFVTFLGALYSHTGVSANSCDTCHNGTYPGVKAKSATHISTPGGTFCDTCHTQGYTSFLGALLHSSYAVTAGSCTSCHSGAYISSNAQPKPATHIPTSTQCGTCHTDVTYTSFSGSGFHTIAANNATITAGPCQNCHNGSYTAWLSSNAKFPQAKSSSHIVTTADCYPCHTSVNTTNYQDFLGAGFHPGNGGGVITGTCGKSLCHDGSGTGGAFGHPNTSVHSALSVSPGCDTCHTVALTLNYTTFLGAVYVHATPPGVCSTCHDGVQATGKPATHIPTSAACSQCHTSPPAATNFTGATFHLGANNATATGVCQTCHTGSYVTYASANGLVPQAKVVPHIPSSGSCDACHTPAVTVYNSATGFLGAGYNHAGVAAGSCVTCHSGAYPGVDTKTMCYGIGGSGAGCPTPGAWFHTATTASCDTCHNASVSANYTTWNGAGVNHGAVAAGSCVNSGCHGPGGSGKGISANHFPTTLSCDAGGCHTNSGVTFAGGNMVHAQVTTKRCDSCHNGSYSAFGTTGAVPKVSNHIPTAIVGSLDCNTCHKGTTPQTAAAATGGAAMFKAGAQPGETMNHNGAPGGAPNYCVSCHASSATYLVPSGFKKTSHNGASVNKDCSSSSCHKPLGNKGTAYSSWN